MTPLDSLEAARLAQLRVLREAGRCPPEPPLALRDPLFRAAAWVIRCGLRLFFRLLGRAMPDLSRNQNPR